MSIRIMTSVWESSPRAGGELLLLLALADFANDEGRCWPAVPTLARKTRLTERHVRRLIVSLVAAGEIVIDPGAGAAGTNVYRIPLPPDKLSAGLGGPPPLTPASAPPDAGVPLTVRNRQDPSPEEVALAEEAKKFCAWFETELERTGATNLRKTPGILSGWADSYEKLRRIDGRSKAEIFKVCQWARRDPFWSQNFLSPVKLRAKNRDGVIYFDLFAHRMTHETSTPQKPDSRRAIGANDNTSELAEYERRMATGS